jgi:hypothetical protein
MYMTLTFRKRLIALKVAAAQRGDLETREMWADIQEKVGLSDTDREALFKPIPNTNNMLVDMDLMNAEPGIEISFEKQERRMLLKALNSYADYEAGDEKPARSLIADLTSE